MRRPIPDSVLFAITWVVIPNLPFLPLLIEGASLRAGSIAAYVVIGFVLRRAPVTVIAPVLLVAVTIDVMTTISGLFNLSFRWVAEATRHALDVNFFASSTYLFVGISIAAAIVGVSYMSARFRPSMVAASATPALVAALVLVGGEFTANAQISKGFGRYLELTAPFDSAMRQSGMEKFAGRPDGRNILVVMVEGLGRYARREDQELILRPFRRADVASRYEVTSGEVPFYGSTASGEVRELCGQWREYRDYIEQPGPGCLPARLARAGYRTTAMHGFTADFYDRDKWFPNIGFQRLLFAEDLYGAADRQCGPVFRGLCDSDLASRVAALLKAPGDEPRFLYWLTLNTHLPIARDDAPDVLGCDDGGGRFADRSVCDLTEMFLDVLERVARLAADRDMPKMDILIVGDHTPPYWKRHRRAFFKTGNVTWISLRDRS
jgi:phosphoglycerol transferase MdoB-like AlkP superfamily enzyme